MKDFNRIMTCTHNFGLKYVQNKLILFKKKQNKRITRPNKSGNTIMHAADISGQFNLLLDLRLVRLFFSIME